jgi:hypothetical protein
VEWNLTTKSTKSTEAEVPRRAAEGAEWNGGFRAGEGEPTAWRDFSLIKVQFHIFIF